MNYDNIRFLTYETNCTAISLSEWEKLMEGHKRANKRIINSLVKSHLPDLYDSLVLNYPNPYSYYKTDTHLILTHSAIEYFLKIN